MDYEVVTKRYSKRYDESESLHPEGVLGEVSIPESAKAIDITCESMSPPLVQVSYLVPVHENTESGKAEWE